MGQQNELLDGFIRCQTAVDLGQPLLEQPLNRLMHNQVIKLVIVDMLFFGKFQQPLHVRDNQGGQKRSAIAVQISRGYVLVHLQGVLDRLRGDVFSPGGYDQIFLPVGNVNEAVLDASDIAGLQPAVLHRLGRRVRIVVIAEHDLRTLDQYFAIPGDPEFRLFKSDPDRTEADMFEIVEAEGRTRFGQAVPFKNRDADDPEEFIDVSVQGGAARAEQLHVAAEPGPEFSEDQPVGQRVFKVEQRGGAFVDIGCRDIFPADGDPPVEQVLLDNRHLVGSLEDPVINLLEQAGNADHDGGADLHHILRNLFDAVGKRHQRAVADREVVAGRPFQCMTQREKTEQNILLADHAALVGQVPDIDQNVEVGEHDPLRRAGGAGRIDQRHHVIRIDPVDARLKLFLLFGADGRIDFGELVEGGDRQGGFADKPLERHDQLQPRQRVPDLEQLGVLEFSGYEQDSGPGVAEHPFDLFGSIGRIDRHGNSARTEDPHVGDDPADPVFREDGYPVSRPDPHLAEPPRHHQNPLVEGGIRQRDKGSLFAVFEGQPGAEFPGIVPEHVRYGAKL